MFAGASGGIVGDPGGNIRSYAGQSANQGANDAGDEEEPEVLEH